MVKLNSRSASGRRKKASFSPVKKIPLIDNPKVLGDFMVGFRATKVLMVSAALDLFSHLEPFGKSIVDVVRNVGCSRQHVEVLLEALVALGVLEKNKSIYKNTPFSKEWLCPSGKRSLMHNYRYQENLSSSYGCFLETVRAGKPQQSLAELIKNNSDFLDSYMKGMAEISRGVTDSFCEIVGARSVKSIVDIGAGHGFFSTALLERHPQSIASLIDFKESLHYARRNADKYKGRIHFVEGDYRCVDFGRAAYDTAVLSHVVHDESKEINRRLLKKIYAALCPGGRLYVHDFMLSGDQSDLFSALFSVHLATYTCSGRVYPEKEIKVWLKEAGFYSNSSWEVPSCLHPGTKILVAKKK